jgi:hypothetical protein
MLETMVIVAPNSRIALAKHHAGAMPGTIGGRSP